jgi:GLPGLI family protein
MTPRVTNYKIFLQKLGMAMEMLQVLKFLFCFVLLVCAGKISAQQKFVFEGKIDYERKINLHRQLDEDDMRSDWFKDFVKTQPPFHISNFTLEFAGNKTIYKLAGELPELRVPWILGPSKENIVQTDLTSGTRQSVKSVFEQKFLVVDSIKNINWRISDEMRTIAGMECRKAVGIICDSVYVVAFYTDEIPVTGGPESFSGLPGMILGLAIPRLHTTWFATRIQLTTPGAKEFEVGTRGTTKTSEEKLRNTLRSSLKDWGKYGEKNTWWVML